MKRLSCIVQMSVLLCLSSFCLAQAPEADMGAYQFDQFRFTLSDADAVARLEKRIQQDHPYVDFGVVDVAVPTDRVGSQVEVGSAETGLFGGKTSSSSPVRLRTKLTSPDNAVTFWFVFKGKGEVLLPAGYRTQEGDGAFFESGYQTDATPAELAEKLKLIEKKFDTVAAAVQTPVRAILDRATAGKDADGNPAFAGDVCGELWKLEESSVRPWSSDAEVQAALEWLFSVYGKIGWSTKQETGWEPIMSGDQITLAAGESVDVRGDFRAVYIRLNGQKNRPTSIVRRLRFLKDTAGGCNPGFDPFRRLLLTWSPSGKTEDGANLLNSHAVNIAADTSPTHFHPRVPVTGGMPQYEMYLVLDPNEYNLATGSDPSSLILYPDLNDLTRFIDVPLKPGDFTYIPPNTGHRGMNVFVIVITLPGFKPHNELYLDADIKDRANGQSPFNPKSLLKKNYKNLDEFLK